MMTKSLRHCFVLLLMARVLMPAEADLAGPIAGYVADPSGPGLRAITGVPGSYLFSDPISVPSTVTRIRLAPGQDFALAERQEASPAILLLKGGAVESAVDLDAMPAADWVAFSANGASAMLFSRSAHRLQVLSGLPAAPRVALDLDAAMLPEEPITGAVNGDASLLLVASANSVWRVSREGLSDLVLSAGRVISIAFLPNGSDAAVSSAGTASIHILRALNSAPRVQVLVSGLQGIGKIHAAADGATLFVARPGVKSVSSIDLQSGAIDTLASAAAPAALIPLRHRDTFLISARPGQPGSIFFRDGNSGRVVFVPAAAQEAAQ